MRVGFVQPKQKQIRGERLTNFNFLKRCQNEWNRKIKCVLQNRKIILQNIYVIFS